MTYTFENRPATIEEIRKAAEVLIWYNRVKGSATDNQPVRASSLKNMADRMQTINNHVKKYYGSE